MTAPAQSNAAAPRALTPAIGAADNPTAAYPARIRESLAVTSGPAQASFRELAQGFLRRAARIGREALESIGPSEPTATEDQIASLQKELARALSGAGDAQSVADAAAGTVPDAFWTAVERLAESVDRESWATLTPGIARLNVVRRERARLRHVSPWARALAARRVGLLHDRESVPDLRRVMARGPRLATLAAALALARIGDREALAWLLENPQATAGFGRHQLVALLKRFGKDGVALLGDAVRRWEVEAPIHLAAIEVLGVSAEATALDQLLRLLKEGRPEARVAAARALGGLGDDSAGPTLVEALDDYAWAVRAQAARSLGKLRWAEAAPRLAARLGDKVWWVRHHAGYALAALGSDGRRTLEAVARSGRDRFATDMAEEVLESMRWVMEGGSGHVA